MRRSTASSGSAISRERSSSQGDDAASLPSAGLSFNLRGLAELSGFAGTAFRVDRCTIPAGAGECPVDRDGAGIASEPPGKWAFRPLFLFAGADGRENERERRGEREAERRDRERERAGIENEKRRAGDLSRHSGA